MAIARVSTNPMYKGGAGGYSFYVRGGEQVVRQRKNNSNYGDTASRTFAQMRRRVMWANLVNFYKVNKFWMPKAFELRSGGQTDYNRFMQLNIPFSEHALTKEQALLGVCAPFTMQVSEGSIPSIQYDNGADVPFVTDIKLTGDYSAGTQTVAQLSQDIINNNARWQNGDNLAIVRIEMAPYAGNPYIIPHYYELTLDVTDTSTILGTLEVFTQSGATFKAPYVAYPIPSDTNLKYGFVMIHTRKVGGQLQVSTQELICKSDDYYSLTEPQHVQEAIDSYGVDSAVPLDPGQGGSSSSWRQVSVQSFTGAGVDAVHSDAVQLPAGRYRVVPNPNVWALDENTIGSNNIFSIAMSEDPTFPGGSTEFFGGTNAEVVINGGVAADIIFNVTNPSMYYRVAGRAADGVAVQAIFYKAI